MSLPISDEPLDVIRANECQDHSLASSRFRRLFKEIDGHQAFRAAVADALAVLRVEFERRASHDSGASEPWRAAFSMAESELRATIAALNLETQ